MTEALGLLHPGELEEYQAGEPATHLAYAVGAVRGACRWHIAPSLTHTVTVTEPGPGRFLMLPTLHLTGVVSVTQGTELVDITDVGFSEAGFVWRRSGASWPDGLCTATVVQFTHGHEDWPAEVKAVIMAAASRSQSSPTGAGGQQAGPFSMQPARNSDGSTGGVVLNDLEKAALDRYRLGPRP